jgi:hypothetical protein
VPRGARCVGLCRVRGAGPATAFDLLGFDLGRELERGIDRELVVDHQLEHLQLIGDIEQRGHVHQRRRDDVERGGVEQFVFLELIEQRLVERLEQQLVLKLLVFVVVQLQQLGQRRQAARLDADLHHRWRQPALQLYACHGLVRGHWNHRLQ